MFGSTPSDLLYLVSSGWNNPVFLKINYSTFAFFMAHLFSEGYYPLSLLLNQLYIHYFLMYVQEKNPIALQNIA